jgi:hypothetical protein
MADEVETVGKFLTNFKKPVNISNENSEVK